MVAADFSFESKKKNTITVPIVLVVDGGGGGRLERAHKINDRGREQYFYSNAENAIGSREKNVQRLCTYYNTRTWRKCGSSAGDAVFRSHSRIKRVAAAATGIKYARVRMLIFFFFFSERESVALGNNIYACFVHYYVFIYTATTSSRSVFHLSVCSRAHRAVTIKRILSARTHAQLVHTHKQLGHTHARV